MLTDTPHSVMPNNNLPPCSWFLHSLIQMLHCTIKKKLENEFAFICSFFAHWSECVPSAHLQQIGYVFASRCHPSPVIMMLARVSPILQLEWSGVDKEKIHKFWQDSEWSHTFQSCLPCCSFIWRLAILSRFKWITFFCTCVNDERSHANESVVDLSQDWAKLCECIASVVMIS